MASINILPTHLVNKIAAGEVIERPASIVKELVENALDAGATKIDIAVEKGGKQRISVSDNGGGMDAADLARAFTPHATSKIACDDDLFRIGTMGFRGEALASIASISHAHIRTRRRDDDSGYEIDASGPDIGEVRPCAAAVGTTVTIGDLFFNTPARRKFLRADSTEMGHISEMITRVALPHHKVAFTLTHNGRTTVDLPAAATVAVRAADLFGAEMAEQLLELIPETEEIKVSGLIGPPSLGKATTRQQYFFLNGRYIRDRFCGHALREGYRGLIDPHRQPVAMIFLTIDPEAVDVNVHPTKVEVRFQDGQAVHSHVLAAIRQTLQQAEIRPRLQTPDDDATDDPRRQGLREALTDFFTSRPAAQPRLSFPTHHDRSSRPANLAPAGATPQRFSAAPSGRYEPAPTGDRPRDESAAPAPAPPFAPPQMEAELAETPDAPADAAPVATETRQVMQVDNTYLVVADAEGLVIVDQHALHERILYDQLLSRITAGPLQSQRLLLPATMTVTDAQRGLLAENVDLLERLGVEVSDFGPDTVAIQRFPSFLDKADPAAFLADALDQLADDNPALDAEHLLHSLLDMMACKAAVKAGDPLTDAEIIELLDTGAAVDKSTACPHGRPTQIRLTVRDLEKQFKRT